MKMDPMKEALKNRAHKVSVSVSLDKEGSPEEEAKESKEEESKERDALGLAPDTSKGKSKDQMMAEGNPPLKNSPLEDGDADLKVILARMGDMGNVKGSLSNKAKEGMKNKLAKKG